VTNGACSRTLQPPGRVSCLDMTGVHHEDFQRVRSPLEGGLVRLRAVEESDIPLIHDLFSDPEVQRTLSVNWPGPVADTRIWWEGTRRNPSTEAFVIETLPGELVGVCSLEDTNRAARWAGLGLWVGRPYWDRGYGTDAVRVLCRFAFREMNLQRVGLSVYDINPRGVRAYEKVGFKEEGRRRRGHFADGRYVDVIVMGLLAEDLIED
jgi:RimJ/RimL family protein N-acetyltransferase